MLVFNTENNDLYEKTSEGINSVSDILSYYERVVDKNVIGWFFPIDIALTYVLIRESIIHCGDICELGVAYGKSAIGLSLCKDPDDKLYLYDNFQAEVTLEHAKGLMSSYGKDHNVIWNVCDLMNVKKEDLPIQEKQLRYLHIDACHLHRAVLNDLNNFSSFVVNDGIICVDDYNDPEYPGINTAITEFCLSEKGKGWKIFMIGQNKAYMCRNDFVTYYILSILTHLSGIIKNYCLSEFIDGYVLIVNSRNPMDIELIRSTVNNNKILDYL